MLSGAGLGPFKWVLVARKDARKACVALQCPDDFITGPLPLLRDSPDHLARGFTHQDGQYLSARWPGDVYNFATSFLALLQK